MKLKKALIGALIVTSIAGLFAYAVITKGDKNKNAVQVTYEKVVRKSISTSLYTNGKVVARDERNVTGDVVGKVTSVNVAVGDKVVAGSVLATIDTSDTANAIRQQEAGIESDLISISDLRTNGQRKYEIQLATASDQLKDFKKAYDDKLALYSADAVSKSEVDAAKSAYEKSKNDYEALKINSNDVQIKQQQKKIEASRLQIAKLRGDIAKGTIKSPISGTVVAVNVKSGEYASQASPMFTIQNIEGLKVQTDISEFDINKVKVGQSVEVGTEGGSAVYKGKVTKIDPSAVVKSTGTGTSTETVVRTEVSIQDAATLLRPNFNVKLTIFTNKQDNALAVPLEAIVDKGDGKKYVFVVGKDSKATQKSVKVGLEGDTHAEIVSGLNDGDTVVLSPPDTLKTGDLVKKSEGVAK